jgi:hypothetical protein
MRERIYFNGGRIKTVIVSKTKRSNTRRGRGSFNRSHAHAQCPFRRSLDVVRLHYNTSYNNNNNNNNNNNILCSLSASRCSRAD